MFERFRDSLVYPSRIIALRKDSFWKVFAYILVFAILMTLGTVVYTVKFDHIDYTIRDDFANAVKDVDIDCVITDSNLTCDTNQITNFYDYSYASIFVDSSDELDLSNYAITDSNIIFHKDSIYLSIGLLNYQFKLSDLPEEFHNIDFSQIMTDKDAFSENLMDGVEQIMLDTQTSWSLILVSIDLVMNIIFVVLIALINSLILKSRFRIIPYKEIFKMSTYTGTALYVLLTFNSLIDLGFFLILLFVIVSVRQTNALSLAIMKVMKKK